jgi:hypothetical protein
MSRLDINHFYIHLNDHTFVQRTRAQQISGIQTWTEPRRRLDLLLPLNAVVRFSSDTVELLPAVR